MDRLYRYTIVCRAQGTYGYGATPEEAKKVATKHYRQSMSTSPIKARLLEKQSVDGSYSFVELKRKDEKTGKYVITKSEDPKP